MNIQSIFTQFIVNELIKLDINNIINYCYDIKELDKGRKYSNYGGWQSNDITHDKFAKKYFLNEIQNQINILKLKLNLPYNVIFDNVWININQKGNFNYVHNHCRSFVSGIFYVKVPQKSGNIFFKNPSGNLIVSYLNYWHVIEETPKNEFFSDEWFFEPEENMLLMFPSWLDHYVQPSESNEDRISIAFNTKVIK